MDKNLKIMIEAALNAGKEIMYIYDREFSVEFKDDKSPLTEADSKANHVINAYLRKTDFPIISEENKLIDYNIRKYWKTCWLVDPVDGTKEFIKRNGEFTVNIALIREGWPELGVIYVPVTKTLYIGDVKNKLGLKAQLPTHDATYDEIIKIAVKLKPKKPSSNLFEIVGSRSHMNQETLDYVELIKSTGRNIEIVSRGSSLKFCLVAEGKADVYPRFAPTMEWDTGAGHAICNAVGVNVISQETKTPLSYNKANLLNPWFLVAKS